MLNIKFLLGRKPDGAVYIEANRVTSSITNCIRKFDETSFQLTTD
jgi:hypothetical protein